MKRLSVKETIHILQGILKLHTTSAVISELQWVDKHAYNSDGKSDTVDDLIITNHLNPEDEKLSYQQKLSLVLPLPLSEAQKEVNICLDQATFIRSEMTNTDNYQYWATRNTLMTYIYEDVQNDSNINKLKHDTNIIEQVFESVHDKNSLSLLNKIKTYYKFIANQKHCSDKYCYMIINQIDPRVNYYINRICGWGIIVQLDSETRRAFQPLDKNVIKQQFKRTNA